MRAGGAERKRGLLQLLRRRRRFCTGVLTGARLARLDDELLQQNGEIYGWRRCRAGTGNGVRKIEIQLNESRTQKSDDMKTENVPAVFFSQSRRVARTHQRMTNRERARYVRRDAGGLATRSRMKMSARRVCPFARWPELNFVPMSQDHAESIKTARASMRLACSKSHHVQYKEHARG